MKNKNCPNCIQHKKVDPITKNITLEYLCKSDGYKKCNSLNCCYNRDNYDDNYGSYD